MCKALIRNSTGSGKISWPGVALNVSHAVAGNNPAFNAVLLAWRDVLGHLMVLGVLNFTAPLEASHLVEDNVDE